MKLFKTTALILIGLELALVSPAKSYVEHNLDNGWHIRCPNGHSMAIAVFSGVSMYTTQNGTQGAAYPRREAGDIIDSNGCYARPMSRQTWNQLMNSLLQACVYGRKYYCLYR